MSTALELIDRYPSINLYNFDNNDVALLHAWAEEASYELYNLNKRLYEANNVINKIAYLAEEQ